MSSATKWLSHLVVNVAEISHDGRLIFGQIQNPAAGNMTLVILANNLKDISFDGESKIGTVGTTFGQERTLRLMPVSGTHPRGSPASPAISVVQTPSSICSAEDRSHPTDA